MQRSMLIAIAGIFSLLCVAMTWLFTDMLQPAAVPYNDLTADHAPGRTPAPVPQIDLPVHLLPVKGVQAADKVIAFTFDNHFDGSGIGLISDILRSHQVRATFFITGKWAVAHPQDAMRLVAAGQEIGIQGYLAENTDGNLVEEIKRDFQTNAAGIRDVTGLQAHLLRTGSGQFSRPVLRAAADLGYKPIGWSINSLDGISSNRDIVVGRVMQSIKPGAIVRMQVSDALAADALSRLLPRLLSQGYRIVTVGELLQNSGMQVIYDTDIP